MAKKFFQIVSELVVIIGILCFVGVFLEGGQSIGKGMYVDNVYEEYSTLFWILFLVCGFCGVFRVLLDIFLIRENYRWLWGIFLIVGLSIYILCIPIFHDFAFHGRHDTVVHYSYSLEIYEYGKPYIEDFYPVPHIWASILASLTGISVRESVMVLPVLLYIVGVGNAFLFGWAVDMRPEVRGLIVMMSALPIFTFYQSMFYPLQIAIYNLWLFAAFFLRTRTKPVDVREVIFLILILLILPFIHPLGVISALLFIISFFFFELLRNLIKKNQENSSFFYPLDRILAPFAILFISWFTWFSSFRVFGVSLNRIYQSIFDELSGQSFTERYSSVIDRANRDVVEIFRLTLFAHGPALFWGILLIIVMVLYVFIIGKVIEDNTFLIVNILVFYGLGILSLAVDIIASSPNRYINYALALVPFFIAPFCFQFYNRSKRNLRIVIFATLLFLITGVFGLGTSNLYFSKIVRSTSHQFSNAQLLGYQFFVDFYSKRGGKIYSPLGNTKEIFVLGSYSDRLQKLKSFPVFWGTDAPEHFGFLGEPDRLGRSFDDPEYLLVNSYEIGLFQVGPQQDRFTPNDFALLEFDGRWHKVYDSGDFTLRVWREE